MPLIWMWWILGGGSAIWFLVLWLSPESKKPPEKRVEVTPHISYVDMFIHEGMTSVFVSLVVRMARGSTAFDRFVLSVVNPLASTLYSNGNTVTNGTITLLVNNHPQPNLMFEVKATDYFRPFGGGPPYKLAEGDIQHRWVNFYFDDPKVCEQITKGCELVVTFEDVEQTKYTLKTKSFRKGGREL